MQSLRMITELSMLMTLKYLKFMDSNMVRMHEEMSDYMSISEQMACSVISA